MLLLIFPSLSIGIMYIIRLYIVEFVNITPLLSTVQHTLYSLITIDSVTSYEQFASFIRDCTTAPLKSVNSNKKVQFYHRGIW